MQKNITRTTFIPSFKYVLFRNCLLLFESQKATYGKLSYILSRISFKFLSQTNKLFRTFIFQSPNWESSGIQVDYLMVCLFNLGAQIFVHGTELAPNSVMYVTSVVQVKSSFCHTIQ